MSVKVVEDIIPTGQAKAILSEVCDIIAELDSTFRWLQPSSSAECREFGNPAKYIVAGRAALKDVKLSGFDKRYPNITNMIQGGKSTDYAGKRLYDGVYKVGTFYTSCLEKNFMFKSDAERAEANLLVKQALGDFVIFLITQYSLNRNDDCAYLSVTEYCQSQAKTQDVFYGEMLLLLDLVNEHPFGFEPISEYYEDMMEIDGAFVSECEEYYFPLTSELCEKVLTGAMPFNELRTMLDKHKASSVEEEVEGISPLNMISKLNLS